MIVNAIADAIYEAEKDKKKLAMFHCQILVHAEELRDVDAVEFCKEIKMPTSYATEFRKMISLAGLMREQRDVVVERAKYSKHTNAHRLLMRRKVLDDPRVEDVAARFVA